MWRPDTIIGARERRPRRRHRRRALLGTLAVIVPVAGLLAACGGGSGSSGGQAAGAGPATGTLTVGIPPVTDIGNLYLAQSKGFFKSRGLNVKIVFLNGGAALIPAMESGSVTMGQSNLVSVLQAQQQHLGIKCFAGAWRSSPRPQLSLVVSPKFTSSITTPAGLAGKTVAVNALNNSNQLVTDVYLKAHGVDPASVHFVGLAYPDMPAALSSGRVAAAIIDEPFTTIVTTTQGSKILAAEPSRRSRRTPSTRAGWPRRAGSARTGSWPRSSWRPSTRPTATPPRTPPTCGRSCRSTRRSPPSWPGM